MSIVNLKTDQWIESGDSISSLMTDEWAFTLTPRPTNTLKTDEWAFNPAPSVGTGGFFLLAYLIQRH